MSLIIRFGMVDIRYERSKLLISNPNRIDAAIHSSGQRMGEHLPNSMTLMLLFQMKSPG